MSPHDPWSAAPRRRLAGQRRILNVPGDVFDIRDRQYQPSLDPLPAKLDRRKETAAVRDQGEEGACTGFAMAGLIGFLYARRGRRFVASPRFLYECAKRYDEWRGEEYEGSSLRGVMKGFFKHGVCSENTFPYRAGQPQIAIPQPALDEAADKPLGAYFRITTHSLNDMQSAIYEVGAILASAQAHAGWDRVAKQTGALHQIAWNPARPYKPDGGHAFLIVGYDDHGFIIQNSWGRDWGSRGFARLTYEDWLANRMDAWVAQLGVGRVSYRVRGAARAIRTTSASVDPEMVRGHYVAIDDGTFDHKGRFQTHAPSDLQEIGQRIARQARRGKPAKVTLTLHGGLVDEKSAVAKALSFKSWNEAHAIYTVHPLWHTGLWEILGDLLRGSEQRDVTRGGTLAGKGIWGRVSEKVQDALDEAIEVGARIGRGVWREMKEDAWRASEPLSKLIDAVETEAPGVEWHIVGHSAGSIVAAYLLSQFESRGLRLKSISFLAPAITCDLFREKVMPKVGRGNLIERFALHTMADQDEREDSCIGIYHKSLLYLVSGAFEKPAGTKILGLARHIDRDHKGRTGDVDTEVSKWLSANAELIWRRPHRADEGDSLHGAFDDDAQTLMRVVERIQAK